MSQIVAQDWEFMQFKLRIRRNLRERIAAIATAENKSANAVAVELIERALVDNCTDRYK